MKIYEKNFDIKVVRARFLTKYRIAPFFFIKIFIKYSSLKLHRLKVLKKKKIFEKNYTIYKYAKRKAHEQIPFS